MGGGGWRAEASGVSAADGGRRENPCFACGRATIVNFCIAQETQGPHEAASLRFPTVLFAPSVDRTIGAAI